MPASVCSCVCVCAPLFQMWAGFMWWLLQPFFSEQLEWRPLFFQEFHPWEKKRGGENMLPSSCLVCCDRLKWDVWAVCILFKCCTTVSHKGKRTDVSWKKGKKRFDGEDLGRFKDGDRKSLCLLFMCYWSDKGCMPGRHPGALNPVFTSQIRHNVHKLFRVPRWCRLLSNNPQAT